MSPAPHRMHKYNTRLRARARTIAQASAKKATKNTVTPDSIAESMSRSSAPPTQDEDRDRNRMIVGFSRIVTIYEDDDETLEDIRADLEKDIIDEADLMELDSPSEGK